MKTRKRIITTINGAGKRVEVIEKKVFDGILFKTYERCVFETSQSFEEAVKYAHKKRQTASQRAKVRHTREILAMKLS